MKGVQGHEESAKGEDSTLGFYELFGMKSSYVDIQITAKLVRGLVKRFVPSYHDGELAELTIVGVTKEQNEDLETLLNQMKIYPWVEEASDGTFTLSLDNKREVNRLAFFIPLEGIEVPAASEETSAESEESVTEVSLPAPDPYAFPLPDIPEDRSSKVTYPKKPKIDYPATLNEVPEVDVWMQHAKDNFDQGLPLETEEISKSYRKGVDLRLFKNRYRFYKDVIKATDGELLSWEEHKDILLAAKNDPEKMKQAVDMSVGLVKMVVDRILKKFSTNEIFDEDDLFQAGMEGLLYGLSRLEEREDIKPASYLVPCIEGYIRTVVRTQKRILAQPTAVANMVAKYRRAQSELEFQIPDFHSLTQRQQEEKIIGRAGLSRLDASAVLTMLNAKKESFDEESIDPDFYEQDDIHHKASLEELKRHTTDTLSTLVPREDLVLRLRFGILKDSRFSSPEGVKELLDESRRRHSNLESKGSITRLLNFDLETDDFDGLNPAEQIFLALIQKIPVSWVAHLLHGDFNRSAATLEDVSAILGTTREVVRQVEAKGLRHLKHPLRSRRMRSHLD